MATARKFGLSLPETKLLARMLVGADDVSLPEMVNAYATFARAGYAPKPASFIDRVVGPKGVIRYKAISANSEGDKREARVNQALQHWPVMHPLLVKPELPMILLIIGSSDTIAVLPAVCGWGLCTAQEKLFTREHSAGRHYCLFG
jgi:membrane carboxypeptidase/penicillin-binding protein